MEKRTPSTLEALERIGDVIPDTIVYWDRSETVLFVNRAALASIGKRADEVLGRSMREFLGERSYLANKTFRDAALAGSPADFEAEGMQHRGPGRKMRIRFFPDFGSDGRVVGAFSVVDDITEYRNREEDLRRIRSDLEAAQAVAHVGSWVLSSLSDDGVLEWSKETLQIFGITAERWDGKISTFFSMVHPEDREAVANAGGPAQAAATAYSIDHRIVRPDGEIRWVHEDATYECDAHGTPVRMIGTVLDITERKLLEDQFREAQKMEAVGRLAGGVAHDFNNLLSVVLSYGSRILDRLPPGDATREEVRLMVQAGERARDLTRQLLAFSRRQVLQPRVIDLGAVVTGMEPLLRPLLGEDVELSFSLKPAGYIRADSGQIEQVVMNLAVNARDAMSSGGKLSIEVAPANFDERYVREHLDAKQGPHVRLSVTDSGSGMDRATQDRIFEPFFTTKGPGAGTGLGLSMVFGIVKQSGASISVESEPGRGSTFHIDFPVTTAPLSVAERMVAAPPGDAGGSETLLLVEDEELLRTLAREILESAGYHILEARSAEEALAQSERHHAPIQLLVTDMVMPRMSGRQLAEKLRPARPEMRVLYVSGHTEDEIVRRGAQDDRIWFLQKPITPEDLTSKVRQILDA